MLTLEQIRDAVLAHWLRHERGASSEELAAALGTSVAKVRKLINATSSRGRLDESHVPGCKTLGGESAGRGRGTIPTRWEPTRSFLTSLVRGEGDHRWMVRARLVIMSGNAPHRWTTSKNKDYEVVAPSREAAVVEAKRLASSIEGELHSNSTFHDVEWLGKVDLSDSGYEHGARERGVW